MTDSNSSQGISSPPVLHHWDVPGLDGAVVEIDARAGETTVLVGANGSGKSALGAWMNQARQNANVHWIPAYRQLWFENAGPSITAADRTRLISNTVVWDQQADSRFVDRSGASRVGLTLFDLVAAENAAARARNALYDTGHVRAEVDALLGDSPLVQLNRVLYGAGLRIGLVIANGDLVNARTDDGQEYSVSRMSDGERNAALLAAEVLAVPPSTVLILDEPERHLHRAISAGLIQSLLDERTDCHFVVLTHDLQLADALGQRTGGTWVVLGCHWNEGVATGWDLDAVDQDGVPDLVREAILGGRSRVLFVEGQRTSLDAQLYRILYPGWTVTPGGGADEVIRAVTGLQNLHRYAWVQAHGIVDGDDRSDDEVARLQERDIYPLLVSEVENVYYLDPLLQAAADAQAKALSLNSANLLADARERALAALTKSGTAEHLARKLALQRLRRSLTSNLPTELPDPATDYAIKEPVRLDSLLQDIHAKIIASDLAGLIKLLPVRDTGLRDQVARALHYSNASDYQAATRVRLTHDDALRATVRTLAGTFPT